MKGLIIIFVNNQGFMVSLNLPSFKYNVKNKDGKVLIFDIIRRKDVTLTPEEWVRQHFIHYMINQLNYPKSLIKVEGGLSFNKLKKRSDVVVYDRNGLPWLIVECKSPDQKIDNATVQQVSVYNASVKAPYLALTNGLIHFCCSINQVTRQPVIMDHFPAF